MKKRITNQLIDGFVGTLSAKDSFLVTTKIPHAIRQAIRINLKTLAERLEIYNEGRRDLFSGYVTNGWATADEEGNLKLAEEHIADVNKELYELSQVDNELEIATINKEVLENYLERNELTLAEEDVLLFFEE